MPLLGPAWLPGKHCALVTHQPQAAPRLAQDEQLVAVWHDVRFPCSVAPCCGILSAVAAVVVVSAAAVLTTIAAANSTQQSSLAASTQPCGLATTRCTCLLDIADTLLRLPHILYTTIKRHTCTCISLQALFVTKAQCKRAIVVGREAQTRELWVYHPVKRSDNTRTHTRTQHSHALQHKRHQHGIISSCSSCCRCSCA